MKRGIALTIILITSIVGMLFSGYLSFKELTEGSCALGGACSSQNIFGIPVCVYGLGMYAIIFLVALWGLRRFDR